MIESGEVQMPKRDLQQIGQSGPMIPRYVSEGIQQRVSAVRYDRDVLAEERRRRRQVVIRLDKGFCRWLVCWNAAG
jgi:hypothetical protein